jgi:ElaB/YqjD/DUF883 family membrane-anchored ribosome-binding protein
MNTTNTHTPQLASDLAERTAATADDALLATRRAAGEVAHQVETGIDSLRAKVPQALSSATAQAEDLARRGIERARQASTAVREQAVRMSDQTVGYIKDEPVKSVLIAAAAGAALMALLGLLNESRRRG